MRLLIPAFLIVFIAAAVADPLVIWPLPPQAPAGVPTATFPAPRTDWLGRFQDNLTKARSGPVDVVFDGDSITDFWQRNNVLQQRYSGLHVIDYAIDWDKPQNVLWRVQNGECDGVHPKLVVLMIGMHNNHGYTAADIAAGIEALVAEYRKRSPDAHILLMATLPSAVSPADPMRATVTQINQLISKLDDGTNITFLDPGPKFLQPDGSLSPELMTEDAILTPKGYQVWADAIQPLIDKYCPVPTGAANAAPPAADMGPVTPVTWPLPATPAGTRETTFPMPRTDWYTRFQGNLDKLKSGPYDLVFDGDSITDNWQGPGQEVWKQRYGSLKALDVAIGGDQVQHVLWRLQHGDLAGQDPKLIVLMIGTNNGGQEPKDIAAGIKLVLDEYEMRCPDAHILLLGIFPRGPEAKSGTRDWIAQINSIISTYDDGKRITYLDFGAKFLQPDGTLTADIMPDFLHPSAKGYVIWADAIQPIIDQFVPKK